MQRRQRIRSKSGSALVEFALVSFAFYLLVAAIITFGQLLHAAQVAQDAARAGSRELSLMPLPPVLTFEQALARPDVRARVYDPDLLVIDLDNLPINPATSAPYPDLESYVADLPVVNRSLRPAMILDIVEIGGVQRRLMRCPGALLASSTAPSGLTVAVPLVESRGPTGAETIRWVPVVEEVRADQSDPASGPFSVESAANDRGLVALRINLPYQSSAMASFQSDPNAPFAPNGNSPNLADDSVVDDSGTTPGNLVGNYSGASPTYGGAFGLGKLQLLGEEVRPFRRVVTAQALFRREVFAY